MASQGLFTQGITVDDLLKKRSIRSQQQQQLMADQAAQGARDPQRARMGSMFGSIIGKALGDNAGGADSEMEKLKASNAQQAALQQESLAVSSGTIAEKRAFIAKIAPIYPEYAQDLNDKVNLQQATDAKTQADKTAEDAALKLAADKYAKSQARKDAVVAKDDLAASVASEERIMLEEEAAKAVVRSQNNAIAMLGPDVDAGLVNAIKSGDKEVLKFAWARVTDKHEDGDDAREVARIYGEGYEVGTDLNKKKLKEKFESSGVTTTVNVNTGTKEAVDADGFQLLSKPQHSKMQESLVSTDNTLKKLQTIKDKFDPDHFGLYGEGGAELGGLLDYVGFGTDTPVVGGIVEFGAERNLVQSQIGRLFNVYRKEVTGAAAAVAELAAIEKVYLNSKKGPAATLVMINDLLRITTETQALQRETLERGIRVAAPKDWDSASAAAVRAAWRAANPTGVENQ